MFYIFSNPVWGLKGNRRTRFQKQEKMGLVVMFLLL